MLNYNILLHLFLRYLIDQGAHLYETALLFTVTQGVDFCVQLEKPQVQLIRTDLKTVLHIHEA